MVYTARGDRWAMYLISWDLATPGSPAGRQGGAPRLKCKSNPDTAGRHRDLHDPTGTCQCCRPWPPRPSCTVRHQTWTPLCVLNECIPLHGPCGPTHEADVDVTPDLHVVPLQACDAPHHDQQQGLLHILVPKDLGGNAGCQAPIDVILAGQLLQTEQRCTMSSETHTCCCSPTRRAQEARLVTGSLAFARTLQPPTRD